MDVKQTHCGRRLVGVLSAVVLVWGLLPLASGIVNAGLVVATVAGMLGLAWGFHTPSACKRKGWKQTVTWIVWGVVLAAVAVCAVMSSFMIAAAAKKPSADGGTVVVLGARVLGDRPSRMLRNRLDAAAAYLTDNPSANCVVSGGLGKDEHYTEAYVMKKYLVACGIASARIVEEDRSTDTHENIAFSLALIRQHGWDERLVIATQEFHQYRAATLAKRAGVEKVSAATCMSPWHLLLCYWIRECAAIARLWIFGY